MRRPIVTGHEFAGTVEAVGPGVDDFAVGDRVAATHRPSCGECAACLAGHELRCEASLVSYGLTVDGGYADSCLAWTRSLVKVPAPLDLVEASFLHCTAAVALRALRVHGGLGAGQWVLVTGAAGGGRAAAGAGAR